ncbi:MAG: hypothetical protein JJU37_13615 [Balneolaceae bacterium]|nr:hypothetical protein [Balneolaceae bacterium]
MNSDEETKDTSGKRKWIALLLLFSCIAAIVLLWNAEPVDHKRLTDSAQIDSLITLVLQDYRIPDSQVRVQTVQIDSVFSRNVYNVRVPSQFSKTSFHLSLHEHAWPFSIQTAGTVQFPERNLRIHLLYNDKVMRSVHLSTDTRLNLTAD